MACTTGCPTQDCESYGACLKGKAMRVAYCNSAGGSDYTQQKQWDRNLDNYRSLRAQGVQPDGSAPSQVRAAAAISDATGTAYKGS